MLAPFPSCPLFAKRLIQIRYASVYRRAHDSLHSQAVRVGCSAHESNTRSCGELSVTRMIAYTHVAVRAGCSAHDSIHTRGCESRL